MAVITGILKRLATLVRNLLRALWVFFPGILFLVLTLVCFWNLAQGKDLMVLATEHRGFFLLFQSLLSFLVLVSWYAARTVANAKKQSVHTAPDYLQEGYYKHMPRFIGFTLFTIIMLAFIQTPLFGSGIEEDTKLYYGLLLASIPYYFWMNKVFERNFKRLRFNKLFYGTMVVLITGSALITMNISRYSWLVVIMLLVLQACFMVLVVTRREILEKEKRTGLKAASMTGKSYRLASFLGIPTEEVRFHMVFLMISLVAMAVYLACTLNVAFAVGMGSFPFVLLAFSVFMGFGFILSFFSIRIGINIHVIFLILIFIFGQWTERHYAALAKRKSTIKETFADKASVRDYFIQWVKDRDTLIRKSKEFPVYFVLSDGGASRSGYWVASVLGKLEDTSQHDFSRHLFCLSGASGGSVGNAAFYTLLKDAADRPDKNLPNNQLFYNAGKEYLRSDFLTYTLSRMLGHDFFVPMIPFNTNGDRAKALTDALEQAPKDSVLLKNQLQVPFSELAIYKNRVNTKLPILCVNTTRMQDGAPSVISTIAIDPLTFNNRVDVLARLTDSNDMKLSTAVVLGASFPYVSPAGRVQGLKFLKKGPTEFPFYFVDGGYVDNSGAGVVHEMIIKLNSLRDSICRSNNDTVLRSNCQKISFYVMHISNGPEGDVLLKKINPFVNDLAAPLKTLMGAYGVQTSINDSRLKNYLSGMYGNNLHYKPINLYRPQEPLKYSMNWVISGRTLDSMDQRLYSSDVRAYMVKILQELKQ
ncbi:MULTISPECIES: patatin-like phospholipase family protein [Niastella]|uniref:Patatin-like phospholipase family protein n=1 Tax=Niastella soli TaxID=2821487 RepID=A0ABS3YNY1_9BACT|nr:patatin-like phospholipase family protein [Niastella soli]MBO9199591.1 patatin-like phospholipase family protein [Niastella soli]